MYMSYFFNRKSKIITCERINCLERINAQVHTAYMSGSRWNEKNYTILAPNDSLTNAEILIGYKTDVLCQKHRHLKTNLGYMYIYIYIYNVYL